MREYIIFTNGVKKFPCNVTRDGHVVTLRFTTGEVPTETTMRGFTWHLHEKSAPIDFAAYTTVYRYDDDNRIYQLSKDGSVYIPPEPVPEPEPYVPTPTEIRIAELNAIIAENKSLLAESDYKVIKNSEYTEAGKDVEYEPAEVNEERQAYRDAINTAETELATLFESEVSAKKKKR